MFAEHYEKMHDIDIPDIEIKTWIFNPELTGIKKFLYVKQTGYPGPEDGKIELSLKYAF